MIRLNLDFEWILIISICLLIFTIQLIISIVTHCIDYAQGVKSSAELKRQRKAIERAARIELKRQKAKMKFDKHNPN